MLFALILCKFEGKLLCRMGGTWFYVTYMAIKTDLCVRNMEGKDQG